MIPKQKYQLFVGTYTGGAHSDSTLTGSEGIYSFSLDPLNGELRYCGVYGNNEIDPGFLAIRGNLLFAENERKDVGTVRSFSIEIDGSLLFIDKVETRGSKCAHVCVDRFGPYIFATNYAAGSVMVLRSNARGEMEQTDHVQHYGKSVIPIRQDAPRAHSTCQTPDGNGILVPDLGLDKVLNYKLDRKTGKIYPNQAQKNIRVAPGEGPRHSVFHPNRRFYYLVTEIGNHIYAYAFREKEALLEEIQKISILPEGFDGSSHSAEIIISRDGKFIYVSNRGHDSITGFRVNADDGKLTTLGYFDCGGKGPRHICLGPEEKFLIIANKDSNKVTVLDRELDTGMLGKVRFEVSLPAPACVVWTNLPNR